MWFPLLDQSRPLNAVQQSLMILTFLGLNLSLNMMGRFVLGVQGFHFAVTVTICHLFFGFLVVLPVMMLPQFRSLHRTALHRQWKGIAAVGGFIALNIVLNNLSLVYITLSLNQIIRSGIPVFTALLGVVVQKKVPTRMEMLGIIALTLGVVACLYEGSSIAGSLYGMSLCLASTLCGAGMLSFSGAVLDRTEKMDALRLNFYSAPVSIAVLVPAFLSLEAVPLRMWWASHTHEVALYVLAGGGIAVLYNVVHSLVIQRTSPVTTPVIGMIKVVLIIIFSSLFLGERDVLTVKMTSGCALAIFGGGLYSQAKMKARPADAEATPELAVNFSDSAKLQAKKPSKSGLDLFKESMINHARREHSPSRRARHPTSSPA